MGRGVWVLENILDAASAPPDVPPIEPDMRERRFENSWRSIASYGLCDCHAKIDPWGFALEFYDPIGAFGFTRGSGRMVGFHLAQGGPTALVSCREVSGFETRETRGQRS